jgi:hypothetical protein
VELQRSLAETLEQQTATSDILIKRRRGPGVRSEVGAGSTFTFRIPVRVRNEVQR